MKTIKIDHVVLQDETDKLLGAIAAYREEERAKAPPTSTPSISKEFEVQAQAMDALIVNVVDSLQSMAGKTIVDILNINNDLMLNKPWEKGDFGRDPMDDNHARFIGLTERAYVHSPARGFLGDRDDVKTAKNILHDYLDATVMYYAIIRKKLGAEIDPAMIEAFVRKGHGYITQDRGDPGNSGNPGNVVPLRPRGHKPD